MKSKQRGGIFGTKKSNDNQANRLIRASQQSNDHVATHVEAETNVVDPTASKSIEYTSALPASISVQVQNNNHMSDATPVSISLNLFTLPVSPSLSSSSAVPSSSSSSSTMIMTTTTTTTSSLSSLAKQAPKFNAPLMFASASDPTDLNVCMKTNENVHSTSVRDIDTNTTVGLNERGLYESNVEQGAFHSDHIFLQDEE
jgi:hypothetical protein